MLISILPACLWYYQYKYVNVIFICLVFGVSVYNGASFYIDVFSRQYIKSLELLQEQDNSGVNNTSSQKSTKTATNTSENILTNENKKLS